MASQSGYGGHFKRVPTDSSHILQFLPMNSFIRSFIVGIAVSASASVLAQESQLMRIYNSNGTGFGAQSLGVAPGRSMVSLYGTVDMAINHIRSGSESQTRVQSGNAWTSKFGIYGQEDLGQGWTTFFRLEAGLLADTGAQQMAGTLFNRNSVIGLHSQRYGQMTLGRQYSSMGSAAIGADPFLGNSHESVFATMVSMNGMGGAGNVDAFARLNKTVRYISPRFFNSFFVDTSLSLKDDQSVGTSIHAKTLTANYSDGTTFVGLAYAQSYCDRGLPGSCASTDPALPSQRTDSMILSAIRDFGPFVGQASYTRVAPKVAGSPNVSLYSTGLQSLVGRNLYRASITYRHTTTAQNYAYGATLGVDHFLSRRTALYGRISILKNGPSSNLMINRESTGNITAREGSTVSDISLGMYHNF